MDLARMTAVMDELEAERVPFVQGAHYPESIDAGCGPDETSAPFQSAPWMNCANRIIRLREERGSISYRLTHALGTANGVPIAPIAAVAALWWFFTKKGR